MLTVKKKKKLNKPLLILATLLLLLGVFMMVFSSVHMILRADAASITHTASSTPIAKTHKEAGNHAG